MKKGAAIGYAAMGQLIKELTPAVQTIVSDPGTDDDWKRENEKLLANAHVTQGWILEHIHGTAHPTTTPDLMKLTRSLQLFKGDVASAVAEAQRIGPVRAEDQLYVPVAVTTMTARMDEFAVAYVDRRWDYDAEDSTWMAIEDVLDPEDFILVQGFIEGTSPGSQDGAKLLPMMQDYGEKIWAEVQHNLGFAE